MKKLISLYILTALHSGVYAQVDKSVFFDAEDPNIQYVGRFDFTNQTQPTFMYSGTEIRTTFTGTTLQLHLKDDSLKNWFTVKLDDSLFVLQSNKESGIYLLADNLTNKKHTLEIHRRTEWHGGNTRFMGFTLDAGEQLLPTKKRNRSIEFIGDSYTCGYGNEGESHDEKFSYATENNYLSYGAIIARNVEADYTGICRSGIGMYQSYGGDTSFTQPKLYNEIVAGSKAMWDYANHQPQLVVINLGSNDLSAPLDSVKFVSTYVNFVQKIRTQYPAAKIICTAGPADEGERLVRFQNLVTGVNQYFKDKDSHVYYFAFQPLTFNGSDWHPNLKEHQQMADELLVFIKDTMNW